jgi:Bacteriophage clamp loader A subunit
MTELKDWLNSINKTKKNLIDNDPSLEKEYSPYVINHCLSGYIDCVMYANEMNITPNLDKKLQYDFYINTLRVKSRFSTWLRKDVIKDLEHVKRYYQYNNEKAQQALKILTSEQLNFIKSKFETGGTK